MDSQAHTDPRQGFSLIELLVAMAVLAVCVALVLPPFFQSVTRTRARTAAQTWQAAASWAQVRQLAGGGSAAVRVEQTGLVIVGPGGYLPAVGTLEVEPATNVGRWRVGSGVEVSFAGAFAAPDSAGSVFFGPAGLDTRVVVRAESGFTYRSAP
jgi:prepilin-type N-terminal cleavage/methylation domain-containing protein